MNLTDMPLLIDIPFAKDAAAGYVRVIPDTTGVSGAASYSLGFPPITSQPISAGGIPPDIKDMNGILRAITEWLNWFNAGAPVTFDLSFATQIGGYPIGAQLFSTATPGKIWRCTTDGNTNDPDTTPTGWAPLVASGSIADGAVLTAAVGDLQITNAKLAAGAASTVKGRAATGGTTDLTMSQLVGLLNTAGGIALASQSAAFTAAGNGYWIKLGDMIIQVGSVTNATAGPATFNFPMTFPTNCFGVFPVPEITSPSNVDVANSRSRTTSGAVVNRFSGAAAAAFNFTYIAIGN